jgi:hypothetical protein
MKTILTILLAFPFIPFSQETTTVERPDTTSIAKFSAFERGASFPGGYDLMCIFIKENLEYPIKSIACITNFS